MWSFVVQNFYTNTIGHTRRANALKKMHTSPYLNLLVKFNSTSYLPTAVNTFTSYYGHYNVNFKFTLWKWFSVITYNNQGVLKNNITLSYYHHCISNFNLNWLKSMGTLSTRKPSRCYLLDSSILLLPFSKTTYNSLVYLSYFILTTNHIVHPMHFSLKTTYSWLQFFFRLDLMLNTFYFKVYRY